MGGLRGDVREKQTHTVAFTSCASSARESVRGKSTRRRQRTDAFAKPAHLSFHRLARGEECFKRERVSMGRLEFVSVRACSLNRLRGSMNEGLDVHVLAWRSNARMLHARLGRPMVLCARPSLLPSTASRSTIARASWKKESEWHVCVLPSMRVCAFTSGRPSDRPTPSGEKTPSVPGGGASSPRASCFEAKLE